MDENEFLRDTLGVEVGQLDEVESAAIEMVREFRSQHAQRQQELRNWKLTVTDSDGKMIVVIPLFPSAT